ncbi:PASTA domain-containing protein [Pedobacter sp. HMF7647]|uniref:PASTA domain-containing protein n=1 Tax=Hufsiella arboris TaxID=2695275 RepID=A0A7K1Y7A4_9SPHI|nr:PASTA domain-containing protein [Hufsiella arboris]MXV50445.1 PASTA domain-containing protein [Hufsiella arboris]
MSNFFLYLKTSEFRKNFLFALISVVAFILVVFFSLRFYTRHGEGTPVPKLKGLSVENAIETLEAQGFRYQIDSVYQIDKQPGLVVEQDPDPNTNVKKNRTIYLTIITRQAPNVGFPDILKMTFLEAQAILSNYGLKVGDTSYISDIARDRILDVKFGGESIAKGQQIPKGSKVDLVLGDGMGASEVDLPDLTGFGIDEAKFSLRGASLNLGNITYEGAITDSANVKIVKQTPALSDSLTKVSIGTRIDIVVSNQQ